MNFSGYSITEKIYESPNSIIYKALERENQTPVIIKVLHSEYPTEEKIVQFKYEYELIKNINISGVITEYEFINDGNYYAIVFEDCGGVSLKKIDFRNWKLLDKLQLFIEIIEIISEIHRYGIIHKDINPSNIILNRETGVIKIIDFGNATKLIEEKAQGISKNVIEGTLAYISPEQTGRMNRVVDYRSDYYSLGATFYEILALQKVFNNVTDPAELIYYHLAKEPIPLCLIDANIPRTVSNIIMRFLAKNAEDRYQSILGIKSDLKRCIQQLQTTGVIEEFPIAANDNLNKFHVSQKLYGRQKELTTLMKMYNHVCNGGHELMLLAGLSGIGKSELVHEMKKNVFHNNGYFVSGKYDKYKKNIPYSAIIDVFRDLIKMILTENNEKIDYMKRKIERKIGANAKVITDVIPELEFLIGKQIAVEELPSIESQHRFNFTFKEFVTAFLGPANTLVIFLDDLQWADDASIEMIKNLSATKDNGYLFIIGAYRDNEVGHVHPLALAVDELTKQDISIEKMVLAPLTQEDISELIADTLHSDRQSSAKLSCLIYERTQGNPFFTKEFLGQLYGKNLIYFDNLALTWVWDLDGIRQAGFASNIMDMVTERVNRQDKNTQRVLQLASIIGHHFDYTILLSLDRDRQSEMNAGLWKALQEGLIQPLDHSYKYLNQTKSNSKFKFTHDGIQQAIYALLTEQEKAEVHLQIGRIIKISCHPDHVEDRVFDIVMHLNLSLTLLQHEEEVQELAELNYLAGKKAKRSSAFTSALAHFTLAIELFGDRLWQHEPQKFLEMYIEATETAYSCAQYHDMEKYSKVAFARCDNSLARMKLYEIKILALLAQNNTHEAVQVALEALEQCAIVFPKKISKGRILYKLALLKCSLYGKSVENIAKLPQMADGEKIAIMRILTIISSSAYLAAPELFILMVIKQVEISIKYGISLSTPFAFCMYGVILCGLLDKIDNGYRLGKIGLEILKKAENKELAGKTLVVASIFITHWKDKPDVVLEQLMRAYLLAQETGDVEYAAWALLCHGFHAFFAGKNIKILHQELVRSAEKIKNEFKQDKQYHSICSFIQLSKKFYEMGSDKSTLADEYYDEVQNIEMYHVKNDKNGIYYIYSNKMILNLFFENYDEAMQAAKLAEAHIDSVISTINYPVFYFYSTLAYLALYESLDATEQKKITTNLEKIKKWALLSPEHHQYKEYLITAEICRLKKQDQKAAECFDLAIDHAIKHGFIQDAALGYELASKFYRTQGKTSISKAYMAEGYYFYQKWGADAKVRELEMKHSYLRKEPIAKDTSISSTSWTANQFVDIASIVKISQLLASEIQYDNLIRSMMNILMKNAGAQKGFFLLRNDERLSVEAAAYIDDECCTLEKGLQFAEVVDEFSKAIVYYVLRIEEGIVIDDAVNDKLFAKDVYVESYKPKSILCIPVVTKNKLIGILYFENNLTTEAFTQERIEFLKIMASQAAISLENIKMYTHLEEKVKERTREIEIQRSFFQQLFTTSPDGIVLLDNEFNITNINHAFQKLFQYSLDEIKGKNIDTILIPAEYLEESKYWRTVHTKEKARFESVRRCKDQSLLEVYITTYPIMAEEVQTGVCVMYSDISTRKQAERQLRYLSLHDSLTGLYNRTCFEQEMINFGEKRDARIGIMICDVDGLKLINDTLGHEVGDRLIKAAALIIKETFRESHIAARIGGDEFAILIPSAEVSLLMDYHSKLERAIAAHNLITVEYSLSISIGFAIKEQDVMFMEEAFKEADSNMYQDKLIKSKNIKAAIVKKLFVMLEEKDFLNKGHVKRLQQLLMQFGEKLRLSEKYTKQLYLLAQFHDIGKVVLPKEIINKPEKLTQNEFAEMQKHSEVGYRIARSLPEVEHIADWIIKHHEWWNGSGYPLGIKEEKVPFACRLFAIVEAYEVMTSGRPYCEKITSRQALARLAQCSGSQFDPQLVQKFVEFMESKVVE